MADTDVIERTKEIVQIREPSMYKVILHNDDSTTFDFVIMVLMKIFHKSGDEAVEITKAIHEAGQGIAGSPYTKEIAEEKAHETVLYSRANNYPLTATFEEL